MIEEYQKILQRDPGSRVFAVLCDAYRELDLLDQGETLGRKGISSHPTYAPGFVALARILLKKGASEEALELLQQATHLSAENVLAWQVLGEAFLQKKSVKEALRAHKMALFLNPMSQRSRDVVKKLEAITADEFAEDLFEMKPLPSPSLSVFKDSTNSNVPPVPKAGLKTLERELSVIDAFVTRQKYDLAKERLEELSKAHPGHADIESRWELLGGEEPLESPAPLKPRKGREAIVIQKKIEIIQNLLTVLREHTRS